MKKLLIVLTLVFCGGAMASMANPMEDTDRLIANVKEKTNAQNEERERIYAEQKREMEQQQMLDVQRQQAIAEEEQARQLERLNQQIAQQQNNTGW